MSTIPVGPEYQDDQSTNRAQTYELLFKYLSRAPYTIILRYSLEKWRYTTIVVLVWCSVSPKQPRCVDTSKMDFLRCTSWGFLSYQRPILVCSSGHVVRITDLLSIDGQPERKADFDV